MSSSPDTAQVFIAYADTPRRRQVLSAETTLLDDYILYGMRDLETKGYRVRHNLERRPLGHRLRAFGSAVNQVWHRMGGYGGDWPSVLQYLPIINQSDLVFSTMDRVGIPLVLLNYLRLVRSPILYASIGLPERLVQLNTEFMRRLYYLAFSEVERIICYGFEEARRLRAWLNAPGQQVQFTPFGVKTDEFCPRPNQPITTDVLSVGADPCRDFSLLTEFARRHPKTEVRIITTRGHARKMHAIPHNVELLTDLRSAQIPEHLAAARVVALPVRENSYSGATTTLLQAMAMAKPVVVSAVGAIRHGYGLQDAINCKMITPGDANDLEHAICGLLANPEWACAIGVSARRMIIERHSWERYIETLVRLLGETVRAKATSIPGQIQNVHDQ